MGTDGDGPKGFSSTLMGLRVSFLAPKRYARLVSRNLIVFSGALRRNEFMKRKSESELRDKLREEEERGAAASHWSRATRGARSARAAVTPELVSTMPTFASGRRSYGSFNTNVERMNAAEERARAKILAEKLLEERGLGAANAASHAGMSDEELAQRYRQYVAGGGDDAEASGNAEEPDVDDPANAGVEAAEGKLAARLDKPLPSRYRLDLPEKKNMKARPLRAPLGSGKKRRQKGVGKRERGGASVATKSKKAGKKAFQHPAFAGRGSKR